MLRASINSPLLMYRLRCRLKGLIQAEPVAPEKMAIAGEIERAVRRVVAVAQHAEDKLMVGQRFVDEPLAGFSRPVFRHH
jgi:hypothetical protein